MSRSCPCRWFVKVQPLAEAASDAVTCDRIKFFPERYKNSYLDWLGEKRDWCISRQLWWGHRIPAWYCDACGTVEVSETDLVSCSKCRRPLRQDDDVLDTWFSSGLWPFTTLGWPDKTPDLALLSDDLLITGFDIIFFWVARMMMFGLKFMDEVPFRQVYIHGLVRDEAGQKMSKSRKHHRPRRRPEAVRHRCRPLTMAMMAAPQRHPAGRKAHGGISGLRQQARNACRFVHMKLGDQPELPPYRDEDLTLVDRWILARAHAVIGDVDRALEQHRFDRAADVLYHFVWHEFCDWYIEMVKQDLVPASDDAVPALSARGTVAGAVLLEVLDTLLRLLHPIMPFITEELGRNFRIEASSSPLPRGGAARQQALPDFTKYDMEMLQELVVKVRNVRAEAGVDPSRRIDVLVHAENARNGKLVSEQAALIAALARGDKVEVVDAFPDGLVSARGVVRNLEVAVPLTGLLDFDAERARLTKDLAKIDAELDRRNRKLANESFLRTPSRTSWTERAIKKVPGEEAAHRVRAGHPGRRRGQAVTLAVLDAAAAARAVAAALAEISGTRATSPPTTIPVDRRGRARFVARAEPGPRGASDRSRSSANSPRARLPLERADGACSPPEPPSRSSKARRGGCSGAHRAELPATHERNRHGHACGRGRSVGNGGRDPRYPEDRAGTARPRQVRRGHRRRGTTTGWDCSMPRW